MPSDRTPTAETSMIEAYVRDCVPSIDSVECGTRLDGGYDLWLRLNPTSAVKQVIITKEQYATDLWKERISLEIQEINN